MAREVHVCCLSCKKPIKAILDTHANGQPFIHRDCPHCEEGRTSTVPATTEEDEHEETARYRRHDNAHDPTG
jgi:hypothetical protein